MRILVCGSRSWDDYAAIVRELQERQPEVVIEGGARGADSLARIAATMLGIPVVEYPARWSRYGKGAGPRRNQEMLFDGKPSLVLAFHANLAESRGTADMVRRARAAGVPVEVISS